MSAVDIACGLAKKFEGFKAAPYLCPAGVATIGYGSTRYADGKKVTMTDTPISEHAASLLLAITMQKCLKEALVICPDLAKENDKRQAAIADFVYNLGSANFSSSTLSKKINAGLWQDVPAELMKWVNGGGKKLPGLVARREAECQLI